MTEEEVEWAELVSDEDEEGSEPEPRRPALRNRIVALVPLMILGGMAILWGLGIGRDHYLRTSLAVIALTSLFVLWDAVTLGERDRHADLTIERFSILLAALVIFWAIALPWAYFRRRRLARPNLGPASLILMVLYLGSPWLRYAIDRVRPMEVSRPYVQAQIESLSREFYGRELISLREFEEVRYDRSLNKRFGRCIAQTITGAEPLEFAIHVDPEVPGVNEFRVSPPIGIPRCSSPAVARSLKNFLKKSIPRDLVVVENAREIRFDAEQNRRIGECWMRSPLGAETIRFYVTVVPGEPRQVAVGLLLNELPQGSSPPDSAAPGLDQDPSEPAGKE